MSPEARLEGHRALSEATGILLRGTGAVATFKSTSRESLELASEVIRQRRIQALKDALKDPELADIFKDPAQAKELVDRHGDDMAKGVLLSTEGSISAAALVFAHSVLDEVLSQCLRVVYVIAPDKFDRFDQSVQIKELLETGVDTVLRVKREKNLVQLSRESICKKIDVLLDWIEPEKDWSPLRGYSFERGKLEQIDLLRHDIVHRLKFTHNP